MIIQGVSKLGTVDEVAWELAKTFADIRCNHNLYMGGENNPVPTEQREAQYFVQALVDAGWKPPRVRE